MSERLPQDGSLFSVRTIGILLAIGIISFAAVMTLLAWSPDLSRRDYAGAHPYSRSALGFGGLVSILRADGKPVSVSRLEESLQREDGRLLIVSLPNRFSTFDPREAGLSGPALIILPKWTGLMNQQNKAWEKDTDLLTRERVTGHIEGFDSRASVWRLRNPDRIRTPFGTYRPDFENEMQVIESNSLEAIIAVPGGALLSKLPGEEIYILSDPDLLNNFGLARREHARFALNLMNWLNDYEGQPIVFDATLHGFKRSGSLLRTVLDIPFLGATLVALATIFLIGWAAFIRFGAPEREQRAISFGKRALADNAAGLVSMAGREGRMAPGYLSLTRRALAKGLGLPKSMSEADISASLTRMGQKAKTEKSWAEFETGLRSPAATRDILTDKARALWRWRKEILHGD